MIPLYYAYVAFSNLSMVSTVMGLYLEHVGFSLATSLALLGAVNLAFSRTDLTQKEAQS